MGGVKYDTFALAQFRTKFKTLMSVSLDTKGSLLRITAEICQAPAELVSAEFSDVQTSYFSQS
jgi:hypothetical protein